MLKTKQQRKTSIFLFSLIFFLLTAFLFSGNPDENTEVHSAYGLSAYVFVAVLSYTVYYKRNFKTIAFWLAIGVGILFIMISLLYFYALLLGSAWTI